MGITLLGGSKANVVVGLTNFYVGTVDTCPDPIAANHIGYSEDGSDFTYTPTVTGIPVAEEDFPVKDIIEAREITVAANLAEATLDNLARAMAGADSSTPTRIDLDDGEITYVSLLIQGNAPGDNSGTRWIFIPRAIATGAVGLPFKKTSKTMVPVSFSARKPTAGKVCSIWDTWDYTIATGVVALVSGKMGLRLAGESGAPDTLTNVTGETSGDEIVLTIADDADPITISHTATLISLTGATSFIMTDYRDWLHLTSNGTVWNETGRFDASA